MKTFTDTARRQWSISLNLGTAMRVKNQLDIDLLQPESGEPPLLTRLGTDEMLLGQVLCVLLEDQFKQQNLTAYDIQTSFDGETLLAAQKAFYEEMIDFFQSRGRPDRAKAARTQMELIEKAIKVVESRIDGINIDQIVDGVMSGSLPDSSASIPGP